MKKSLLIIFTFLTVMFCADLQAQQVQFTANSNNTYCVGAVATFTNTTHMGFSDTTKMTFKWYFGDGDSASTYDASHTYNNSGFFIPVRLVGYDSLGVYVNELTVHIDVVTTTSFQPASGSEYCVNEPIQFSTFDSYNSILFDYGDGNDTTDNFTYHAYSAANTYTVSLIIDHPTCGLDTLEQIVNITTTAVPLVQAFSNLFPLVSCPNEEISFQGFSPGGNIQAHHWDFGDGDTSNLQFVDHAFPDTGTYKVVYTGYNLCGNPGSDTLYVSIVDTMGFADATFFFNSFPECPYSTLNFNPQYSNFATYEWDFGDGGTSTSKSPLYSYTDTGMYTVRLIVTSGCGTKDTTEEMVTVQFNPFNTPGAQIQFNNNWALDTVRVCPGEQVELYNNSWSGTASPYLTFSWNFGDGNTSTSRDVMHTYATADTFQISMAVTNSCNNSDTTYKWVIVDTNTVPSISNFGVLPMDTACPGGIVYFFDDNFDITKGYSYSIWFGDGDSLMNITNVDTGVVQVLAQHAYPLATGTYHYTFMVTNACGNSAMLNDSIVISNANGNPFYYVDNSTVNNGAVCPGENVSFLAVGGASYKWFFADGDSATGQNAIHSYNAVGIYNAFVEITNHCGGIDTVYTTVDIQDLFPSPWYMVDKPFACGYDTVNFIYQGGFVNDTNAYTFVWIFGDGDTSYAYNPSHVYTQAGTYWTNLYITNSCGNTAFNQVQITVDIPNVSFSGLSTEYCISDGAVALTGLPSGGVFSGAGVSGSNFDPATAGAGTHAVKYTFTRMNGCYNWQEDSVTVNALPMADAGTDKTICTGGSTVLNASGGTAYSWSPSTDLTNHLIATPVANPTITTTYYVNVTDSNGCMASDSVIVDVVSSLTANAGIDDTVCIGLTIQLNGTGGGDYSWSPAASLSNSSIANPVASPTITTIYVLTVSSGSCSDVDSVRIFVDPCSGTSINDLTAKQNINVYPNPSIGIFTIEYPANGWLMLQVIDMAGKVVYNQEIDQVNNQFKTNVDLSGYAKGIYNLRVITNETSVSERIILK